MKRFYGIAAAASNDTIGLVKIQVEDSRVGGPVTEGFKDLLLLAVAEAMERRRPNPEAMHIADIAASGDLDRLDAACLKRVFDDAGLYCQRIIFSPPPVPPQN